MQLPATANKLAMQALKNIPDSFVFAQKLHFVPLLANMVTMNTYLQWTDFPAPKD